MAKIRWNRTHREASLIHEIAERAISLKLAYDLQDCEMDVTAAHANGCPLDLQALLAAKDFDFGHDIVQINRHLDRSTGKLTRHFRPRFAMKEVA